MTAEGGMRAASWSTLGLIGSSTKDNSSVTTLRIIIEMKLHAKIILILEFRRQEEIKSPYDDSHDECVTRLEMIKLFMTFDKFCSCHS